MAKAFEVQVHIQFKAIRADSAQEACYAVDNWFDQTESLGPTAMQTVKCEESDWDERVAEMMSRKA